MMAVVEEQKAQLEADGETGSLACASTLRNEASVHLARGEVLENHALARAARALAAG